MENDSRVRNVSISLMTEIALHERPGSQAYVTTPGRTHLNANSSTRLYRSANNIFFGSPFCPFERNSSLCRAPEKYWIIIVNWPEAEIKGIIRASVTLLQCYVRCKEGRITKWLDVDLLSNANMIPRICSKHSASSCEQSFCCKTPARAMLYVLNHRPI